MATPLSPLPEEEANGTHVNDLAGLQYTGPAYIRGRLPSGQASMTYFCFFFSQQLQSGRDFFQIEDITTLIPDHTDTRFVGN